jgi:hypothetical protein
MYQGDRSHLHVCAGLSRNGDRFQGLHISRAKRRFHQLTFSASVYRFLVGVLNGQAGSRCDIGHVL